MSRGLLHDSLIAGPIADRPTEYPGQYDIAIYHDTDNDVLYTARKPSSGTTATWVQVMRLSDFPTADQNDSETVWNDSGTLKVSSAP